MYCEFIMSDELEQNKKVKAERLTLGKRHQYENEKQINFTQKAKTLGFSAQEIEAMKRLYKNQKL